MENYEILFFSSVTTKPTSFLIFIVSLVVSFISLNFPAFFLGAFKKNNKNENRENWNYWLSFFLSGWFISLLLSKKWEREREKIVEMRKVEHFGRRFPCLSFKAYFFLLGEKKFPVVLFFHVREMQTRTSNVKVLSRFTFSLFPIHVCPQ